MIYLILVAVVNVILAFSIVLDTDENKPEFLDKLWVRILMIIPPVSILFVGVCGVLWVCISLYSIFSLIKAYFKTK